MSKNKLIIMTVFLSLISLVIGYDFGREQYVQLQKNYSVLSTKYENLAFQTYAWNELTPDEQAELNSGNRDMAPGEYTVGENGFNPGKYKIYVIGNEPGTLTVNEQTYNLCPDPSVSLEPCYMSVDGLILEEGDVVKVDDVTVRTAYSLQ
jgi:hypothetical protein